MKKIEEENKRMADEAMAEQEKARRKEAAQMKQIADMRQKIEEANRSAKENKNRKRNRDTPPPIVARVSVCNQRGRGCSLLLCLLSVFVALAVFFNGLSSYQ